MKNLGIALATVLGGGMGALAITPNEAALDGFAPATLLGSGSAIIDNGRIKLGVNPTGSLNVAGAGASSRNDAPTTSDTSTTDVGLRYMVPQGGGEYESTAPGCLCEGWGVSGSGLGAQAAVDGGNSGLTTVAALTSADGFASKATSVVTALASKVTVTHDFHPSTVAGVSPFLYEVTVSILNNSAVVPVTDLRYVRVMDWDIETETFNELVTIGGVGTTSLLVRSHDNGFSEPNPLVSNSPLNAGTLNANFVDNGPDDHGAYFQFSFGDLAPGATKTFNIYYGATPDQATANSVIFAQGIELYSYGQSRFDGVGGTPATFIFGFAGVGGVVQTGGGEVPEASTVLGGLAVAGMVAGGYLRRRNAAKA